MFQTPGTCLHFPNRLSISLPKLFYHPSPCKIIQNKPKSLDNMLRTLRTREPGSCTTSSTAIRWRKGPGSFLLDVLEPRFFFVCVKDDRERRRRRVCAAFRLCSGGRRKRKLGKFKSERASTRRVCVHGAFACISL